MKSIIRNIVAVIAGFIVGSIVNMGLIMLGPSVIPPPEGADVTSMEGLRSSIHLFEPANFIFPFLAHALGTLAGAMTAAFIGVTNKLTLALVVSVCFLIGGIVNVILLPSPMWFNVLDLVGAYIPMGWIGGKYGTRKNV